MFRCNQLLNFEHSGCKDNFYFDKLYRCEKVFGQFEHAQENNPTLASQALELYQDLSNIERTTVALGRKSLHPGIPEISTVHTSAMAE
jgi:hypothetical protein